MKFKFLFIILLLSSLSVSLFAKSFRDSIGIENQNGKKVILHKVEPHESFYSIARRYKVEPKTVIAFNNNAPTLAIGQTVKVPTDLPYAEPTKAVAATKPASQKGATLFNNNLNLRSSPPMQVPPAEKLAAETQASTTQYKVSAGETLYAISKRFNTTVADITALNNLKSTNLTPGQVILVRATPLPVTAVTVPTQPVLKTVTQTVVTTPQQTVQQVPVQLPNPVAKRDTTLVATMDSVDMSHRNIPANRYGLLEKNEKGLAVWMDSDNLDPNKKWVLHRTAPIGTVIKITNPMTNRTTFAKVVGRFTDNENTKDAIMVMTKSVAESIGAMDKRFHVTISYGTPNE